MLRLKNRFVERRGGGEASEHCVAFFAAAITDEEEERAFADAWRFTGDRRPCVVFYYSKYERTRWRKLQSK